MSEQNDDLEDAVNDILSQLKQPPAKKSIPTPIATEISMEASEDEYHKQLEAYILTTAKHLVENAVETVEAISVTVQSAPTPEDVSAYASALNSTTTAIGSLLNLLNTNKKIKTQVKIKKMDLENKKQLTDIKCNAAITMTREEALARMVGDAKVINVESQILSS